MTERRLPWWAVICLILLTVLITFVATFLAIAFQYDNRYYAFFNVNNDTLSARLEMLDSAFRELYVGEIEEESLATVVLKAYVYGTGDPYGEYLTAEEYQEVQKNMQGELCGIGVTVDLTVQDGCEILLIMPDSPAERAGLQAGDLLVAADGVSFAGLTAEEMTEKISGTIGTYVTVTVQRGNDTFDVRLIRENVTTLSVLAHIYNADAMQIGVIRILSFDATTPTQCMEAMERLSAMGVDRYVFDLRDNGGGGLESVTQLLDKLLPEGPIIHITDEETNETITSDAAYFEADGYVVLVNGNTASAAELFSCALRDYGLAQLVGTQTYGKGCMQTYVPLHDGGCLRVTFSYYDPPYSANYDGIGLTPDVIVEPDELTQSTHPLKIADTDDNQLMAAIAQLIKAEEAA